jgi:uncharacterized membrane protein
MFSFKKKEFFTESENARLVQAIRDAERLTSGEIRLYVESKCKYVNPMDRAAEAFHSLKMSETSQRNAVIVYIALDDQQFAILGDEGIHQKVGIDFWQHEANLLISYFSKGEIVEGLEACIREIGNSLCEHFPHQGSKDQNELPDDIVYGK